MIYFATAEGTDLIKIGTSKNVSGRMKALAYAMKRPVSVLAVCDGGLEREKELHRQFERLRVEGEWFSPEAPLLEFIQKLPALEADDEDQGSGFYVRLPDIEMRDAFKQYAKSQNRSMNGQVIELIKKAIGVKK